MAKEILHRVSSNTFILSPPHDDQESPRFSSEVLLEALYLYVSVPFRSTHNIIVSVSIVPFSIPSHRSQIFYHAEASFAKCCKGLEREDFMPTVISTAQKSYSMHMPSHPWNFKIADVWRQLQIPREVAHEGLACSEKADLILSHLLGFPEATSDEDEFPGQVDDLIFSSEQQSRLDKVAERASGSSLGDRYGGFAMRGPDEFAVKHRLDQSRQACPVTKVAEEFLNRFHNTRSCSIVAELRNPLSNIDVPDTIHAEPATQALKCCAFMAGQAKEQLKHATFTRFISLCFFLIWETLACEPGKAGARMINARMKEAGFEGNSRSLKTLRNETSFINQLVASVEKAHGTGVASLVFYHIFSYSNYHLIRLMNRYGVAKQRLAIKTICNNLDAFGIRGTYLPILRIQDLLKERMPGLPENLIDIAIGYLEVDAPVAIEQDSDFF